MLKLKSFRMATPTIDPAAFLATVAPFDQLPGDLLAQLAAELVQRDYAAGITIYEQDLSELQELSVIYRGQVEKYFLGPEGRQLYNETFVAGDSFGAISILLNNGSAIRSVRTQEQTTLFQLPKQRFKELCQTYPAFYEFFTHQFGRRMLDGGYAQILMGRNRSTSGFQVSDRAFTQQVGQLYHPNFNQCTTETSIREAARSMSYFRQNYVLVVDPEREPVGLITDRELRDHVVAEGLDVNLPVSKIMYQPVREIQATAYSYEAILLMFRHKVDYLAVRDGARLAGVISLDKLLNAQGKSPFIFVQSIAFDHSAEALRDKWAEVPGIVDHLVERGTRPEIVNQVVSVISDAIAHNIIRRTIERLGPPPAKFVFMALGSEGRKEQTLRTDQDNAIIYEDLSGEVRKRARHYFLKLGQQVCDELAEVGFAYCEGGLMAKNTRWNHSLSHWQDNYRKWITEPGSENALIGGTFFDCRAIYGEVELLQTLRRTIFANLEKGASPFFSALGRASLLNKVPLNLFGSFQLTEHEQRKGINIKRATSTISDFARLYALQHQLAATNTGERLRQLTIKGVLTDGELDELLQSYYFMMRLRLTHQSQQLQAGETPDNIIDPDTLTKIERVTLREIFRVVEKYQKRVSIVFTGTLG
jgi:CBS domain-containing protein